MSDPLNKSMPVTQRVAALSATRKRLLRERLRALGAATGAATGGGRLVAFVSATADHSLDQSRLRDYCDAKLPAYMVPQVFVELDAFPTTAAGKVDRRALQEMDIAPSGASDGGIVGPRTPIEQKLVEIWGAVLGFDDISIHDNFFEIGGDSLQIIRILSRAAKEGLSIAPDVVLAHPTIAGQAQFAEAAPDAAAGSATQAASGPLPLLPIQHWFFERITVEPQQWNQSVLFELGVKITAPQLESVVRALLIHHPALRTTFEKDDRGWHATIHDVPDDAPVCCEYPAPAAQQAGLETQTLAAATTLNAALDLSAAPLFRVALLRAPAGQRDRLLIVIHHLVVDAQSWRILRNDLNTAIEQVSKGLAVRLPAAGASIMTWAKRLDEYANSPVFDQHRRFWRATLPGAPAGLPTDAREHETRNEESAGTTLSVTLGRQETAALTGSTAQALYTRVNVLLVSALARTLADWTGDASVMFDMEGHGRESLFDDVNIARTVGWFTTVFPVILRAAGDADWHDPVEAVKIVKEQFLALPLNGLSHGLLAAKSRDPEDTRVIADAPRAQLLFNYLGQVDEDSATADLLRLLDDRCGPARSPRCDRAYLIEINALLTNGVLRFNWTYAESIHHEDTVKRLADNLVTALQELIAAAGNSAAAVVPSDFPLAGLSASELDSLAQQLGDLDDE
jgi:non-ribosomal peptide synthase protein (TIGR01720 family)